MENVKYLEDSNFGIVMENVKYLEDSNFGIVMENVKYLEDSNFGILHSEDGVSLDDGKTYFDFSSLSETEKTNCIEDCLAFFLEDFEGIEEALAFAHAASIEEIEDRICYLLK